MQKIRIQSYLKVKRLLLMNKDSILSGLNHLSSKKIARLY